MKTKTAELVTGKSELSASSAAIAKLKGELHSKSEQVTKLEAQVNHFLLNLNPSR